jgi:hypothetical protein
MSCLIRILTNERARLSMHRADICLLMATRFYTQYTTFSPTVIVEYLKPYPLEPQSWQSFWMNVCCEKVQGWRVLRDFADVAIRRTAFDVPNRKKQSQALLCLFANWFGQFLCWKLVAACCCLNIAKDINDYDDTIKSRKTVLLPSELRQEYFEN